MADALGLFELGFAFLQIARRYLQGFLAREQVAVREHACQRVFQAPGDLLEEPALRGGPGPRMRALVQPEQVGPVSLGTDRNRDDRLDAEPLAELRRDAQIRRRPWTLQHA